MQTYSATTHGITVTAHPLFLDGQSDPILRKFVFAYFISILNDTEDPVKLLRRHWYIHDSAGDTKEVDGEGVIGKQPLIKPGESHTYNSFCVLESFEGYMEGTYLMEADGGDQFEIAIPRFTLRASSN